MEMEDEIYGKIVVLCNKAEDLIDNSKPLKAITLFQKAFDLIPKPKIDWEASTWVLTAIGDTYFLIGDYSKALQYLKNAETCPNGNTTDFLLLRIGQAYYEIGNIKAAREYLLRTYLISSHSIFNEEDIKYKKIIMDLINKDDLS